MAQKPMDKYTTNTAESVKLLSELECGCNVNTKRNISYRILCTRQSAKILPIRSVIEFMKKDDERVLFVCRRSWFESQSRQTGCDYFTTNFFWQQL